MNHTLELGWYNLQESELETASLLDRLLYWLLHAHQYDAQTLGSLFSKPEFQKEDLQRRVVTSVAILEPVRLR